MKKTLILLILFLILGGGTYWFINQDSSASEPTLGWDRQFKIKDIEEVHKVFIAKRNGNTTTLEKNENGKGWTYNGKYPAHPNAVKNVLKTLQNIRMKYVPPKNSESGMVQNLASQGIKVEVYDKSGNNLKTYYIGGTTPDERGTYMIMEGSEQPLVGELPTLEGSFRVRFEREGDDWRDKKIFGYEIDQLEFVSIEYPKQKNQSFNLEIDGTDYKITPFYELTQPINKPIANGTVESFLVGFSRQIAEDFINKSPDKNKVFNEIPFAIIRTRDINGVEKEVTLFPQEAPQDAAVNRYFAHVASGDLKDFMVVQHLNFKKILWGYQGFFSN